MLDTHKRQNPRGKLPCNTGRITRNRDPKGKKGAHLAHAREGRERDGRLRE